MSSNKLGSDAQRADGVDKVRGRPLYGGDRNLPRMAYALPVLAMVGKGRIKKLDTSAAESTPGVVLVLTHLNMEKLKPIVFLFAGGHASQSFQPMQSDAILYRGQVIALIVADTPEAAYAASAAVAVDYESAPFSVELDSAGAATLTQSVAAPFFPDFIAGDAERAFASAAVQIDETYATPAQHHNCMELFTTVAEWQGDHLVVHEGTQAAQALAQGLAIQLAVDPAKVRVIAPYVGGGFGARNTIAPHTVLAAVAAKRVGRPVKLTLSREQGFYDVHFRPAARHRLRLGADKDGKFVAAIHHVRAQTSQFDLFPFTGAETTARMYGIPNFKSGVTLVKLDTQTPGFMRAPMEMSSAVALEGAIDSLAYKLERDPVDLRLANDADKDPITGKPFSARRLNDCLRRGAEKFGWSRRSARPASMRADDGTLIGWGVATGGYPGYIVPAVATVRLNVDGTAEAWVGGHEMGQGIRTPIALAVAEELGIEPTKVRVTVGDTIAPPQHLTAGSWGTASAIPPLVKAARSVRAQLKELGAGPGMAFSEVMKKRGVPQLVGRAEGLAPGMPPEMIGRAGQGLLVIGGPEFPEFVTFSYVAHFVEVRINPRIPRPRVTRVVSVVDCGRVMSLRTARSQVYGGIVWGVGAALAEESEVDPRFGGFLNTNIAEYQVPVNADIGSCEVDFIDDPDLTFNSMGVRSLGEVASVGVAAAIVNAVFHATGRRVRDLPLRIEEFL